MAHLVALTGLQASGKSTVAGAITTLMGWRTAGFGQYLQHIAQERHLTPDRANLQRLGQSLVNENPRIFCEQVVRWAGWVEGESLILDGVRHIVILDALRGFFAPQFLYLVYVDVDEALRRERLLRRGAELTDSVHFDLSPTEVEVPHDLRRTADIVVNGGIPPTVCALKILEFVTKGSYRE